MNDKIMIFDETNGKSHNGNLLFKISKIWNIEYVTNEKELLNKLKEKK